jgi:uncharacterized protein DUF542
MPVDAQAEAETVGEIASTLAGATVVFRKHKIDFCCGGALSLDEAASRRSVNPAVVRRELDALARKPPDIPTDSAALCDHLVERYHDVDRHDLPEFVRLARRVESVHRDHPLAPRGLADALEAISENLLDHMTKERKILFRRFAADSPVRCSARSPLCATSTVTMATRCAQSRPWRMASNRRRIPAIPGARSIRVSTRSQPNSPSISISRTTSSFPASNEREAERRHREEERRHERHVV